MGQSASAVKGIDPSHVRVADSEGSLVLHFADGERAVATVPGTVMYTLGHYLRRLNMFEDLLINRAQSISRPLPLFVSRSDYIPKEYEYDPEDRYEAAYRGDASVGLNALSKEKEGDIATIPKASGGDDETPPVGDEEAGKHEEKETEEEMETRIEQERILHAAIKQRKIIRLVSQYPVQLSTPFVDEFYQRITNEDSPYDIFDSGLIIVYRLWANTGSHQMFLIRGIREFIKSRQRLGSLWTVDTLESFLVCTLYTEYDLIQSDLMIEPADYDDIESRMMARLHKELEKLSPPPPPSTENEGSSSTTEIAKGEAVLSPDHDYGMPSEVYYMQKREEIEIHRLAKYYQQKTEILENLYGGPSEFERVSNPFYQRLKDIQNGNSRDLAMDKLAPFVGRSGAFNTYKRTLLRTKDETRPGKEREPHQIRQEQDLLQNVLESLASATETTRDNWSEYMECTRKILIEVRDLTRQVRGNQEEAEAMAASDKEIVPTLKTTPVPTAEDVEAGAGVSEPETGEHSVRMDVLNAKIVWGHGVPIVDEDGLPIGPYSPDKPHLPLPTLERLEFLLDAAGDCLIRSLGLDISMED